MRVFLSQGLTRRSLAVLLLIPGCQDDDLPHFGALKYESESFEIWASDGLEACGGTFEYTEQWLHAFRERVGEHGSPVRHTFYWLSPQDLDDELCSGAIACAYPLSSVIYSIFVPYEHELVHVELAPRPPSLLREGAAEVFGSIESPHMLETVDLDPLFDAAQVPGYAYQTAGRFSRFLIDRYGLDAYFELYQALDGAEGRAAFETEVVDTLGIELSALVEDFEQAPRCSVERWRFFDRECSDLPLTPWESPMRWADEIDLSCAAADVIGPRSSIIWTRRALEIGETDNYLLTIESSEPTAQVALSSCNSSCFDDDFSSQDMIANLAAGGRTTMFLQPGRYWLQVEHTAGSDAPVTVALER